eukprot:1143718-Pelagomonas_calceolata.AAC.1
MANKDTVLAASACAPKGQGSLIDMGCTKADIFGAVQHGGGCWERGGSRAGQLGAWGVGQG